MDLAVTSQQSNASALFCGCGFQSDMPLECVLGPTMQPVLIRNKDVAIHMAGKLNRLPRFRIHLYGSASK